MSFSQAGSCPRCGAPIWIPTVWHAVTPPPVTYSCMCTHQPGYVSVPAPTSPHIPGAFQQGTGPQKVLDALQKKVDKVTVDTVQDLKERQENLEKLLGALVKLLESQKEPEEETPYEPKKRLLKD